MLQGILSRQQIQDVLGKNIFIKLQSSYMNKYDRTIKLNDTS